MLNVYLRFSLELTHMHHESLYEHVSFDFPGFVIQVYYLHATNFALAHNKIPLVHYDRTHTAARETHVKNPRQ